MLAILTVLISSIGRISGCSSDLSGSSTNQATFDIAFYSPLSYTYPPQDVERVIGQSLTAEMANSAISKDLNLAISQAMQDNMMSLATPPTLNYTFVPAKILVDSGDICKIDGTFIAIDGTVIYKCYAGNSSAATTVSSSGSTTVTSAPSTESTISASSDGMLIMLDEETTITSNPSTASSSPSSSSAVKSTPFEQKLSITATISQALFESQWIKISRSVQKSLEAKKVIFNDDITVALLSS